MIRTIIEIIGACLLMMVGIMLLKGKMVIVEDNTKEEDMEFLDGIYKEYEDIKKYMDYVKNLYTCKKIDKEEYGMELDAAMAKLKNIKERIKEYQNG